jgi:hypothetical protein
VRIALERFHPHADGLAGVKADTFSLNSSFSVVNYLGYEGFQINTSGGPVMFLTLAQDCLTNRLKFLLMCLTG